MLLSFHEPGGTLGELGPLAGLVSLPCTFTGCRGVYAGVDAGAWAAEGAAGWLVFPSFVA